MSIDVSSNSVPPGSADSEPASALLMRLLNDASALLRNEIALAKSEVFHALTQAKTGAMNIAMGAAVVVAGALALLAAAILVLALIVPPWLAALIVGILLVGIGVVMLITGKKKVAPSAFTLERTQESLRRDTEVLRRA